MELITINDSYSSEHLAVFAKWGIKYPKVDEIVELLRIDKYRTRGKTGLIVKPYEGQFIKGEAYGQEIMVEVSFDKSRFTTLLGLKLTDSMLREFKENQKNNTSAPIPPKTKENERIN